ncbi:MAG TPA: MraY family glycosyltransferase, partial [bacterium]|nr:MraY family glycosyltransferase [bacterium]
MSAYHFLFLLVQTFTLAALLTPLMRRIAPGLGFLDQPGERKVHHQAKPVLGGAAIFLAQMIVVFVDWFLLQWLGANVSGDGGWFGKEIEWLAKYAAGAKIVRTQMCGLVLGGLVVFLVGLYDDRFGMNPLMKLAGQILAGIILYAADIRATFLIPSDIWSFGLTIFWVVLITNSFNLLDNMDGLSGGVATISLLVLALATNWLGAQDFITAYLVTLAGAILGFLLYNFYP